jgi:putative lipoprotein (rSAM/lipoprotein system)
MSSELDLSIYDGEPEYIVEFKKTALRVLDGVYASDNLWKEYFGDDCWFDNISSEELEVLLQQLGESNEEILTATEYYVYKPQNITYEQFNKFIDRLNNTTLKYKNLHIDSDNYIDFDKLESYLTIIREVEEESIRMGYLSVEDMFISKYNELNDALSESSSSVCSTISLQLSQTMTFTRQAFLGKLSVFNGSEDTPMRDIRLTLKVTDEDGNPIEGISVVFQASSNMLNKELHRVATDKNGKYETDYIYYILGSSIYQALYTDIDGEENGGHFEDKIVEIHKMDKTKVKDGERWYMGVYDLSAEVKLTRKPAEQEPENQPEQEPGN